MSGVVSEWKEEAKADVTHYVAPEYSRRFARRFHEGWPTRQFSCGGVCPIEVFILVRGYDESHVEDFTSLTPTFAINDISMMIRIEPLRINLARTRN